jgi:hypothetical protein
LRSNNIIEATSSYHRTLFEQQFLILHHAKHASFNNINCTYAGENTMDLLAELETMAGNAQSFGTEEIDIDNISRWKKLFGFGMEEARKRISEHRADLGRARVCDELWNIIGPDQVLLGHTRETYEFSLNQKPAMATRPSASSTSEYLLKLEGPLRSARRVREEANLTKDSPLFKGTDDADAEALFVIVDGVTRDHIIQKYAGSGFQATIIRLAKAAKDLCAHSIHPKLGLDSTLPQYRNLAPVPQQSDYPVHYFFYGTLAEPDRLSRLLDLKSEPFLE